MTQLIKIKRTNSSGDPLTLNYGEFALAFTGGRIKLFAGNSLGDAEEITAAANIKNTPSGTITSTNVQAALNELDSKTSFSALTVSGNGNGLTFSGTGNHDITASSGFLRLGALTLTGTVSGNAQNISGINSFGAVDGTFSGDIAVNGGDLTSSASTFNLLSSPATVNAFGAAGTLTLGYNNTAASTTNISTGAVASSTTKTINIGTGGASGSDTRIKIGSENGTSITKIQGTCVVGVNGNGYTPTEFSIAGCGIVWNKNANASGATYFQNYRQSGAGGFVFELYDTNSMAPSLLSTPLSIDGNGNALFGSNLRSAGSIGYSSSAYGTVTQNTSKNTNVTLNKLAGTITMNNAALAAGAEISFYVFNSFVEIRDTVVVTTQDGFFGLYTAIPFLVGNGAFAILVKNTSGSSQSEALKINFTVLKNS